MNFLNELTLIESELSSKKEEAHVVAVINTIYNEWKKMGRRKNAVDIITTTVNKISNFDPAIVARIHDSTRLKLASLLVRCFDIPYWKNVSEKEKLYRKLQPLLSVMQNDDPNTDSGGNLRDAICTRLSASICYNSKDKNIFVAYEPKISDTYLRYLFGKDTPEKTYKMQTLMLPGDFESLVQTLQINHDKAVEKFKASKTEQD
jgi:hypothetical protein